MNLSSSDWLECLQSGDLELTLPQLTLVVGNGSKFSGNGRVAWRAESCARVSALTDGAEAPFAPLGVLRLGQLIPATNYIHLIGNSQEGWEARTDPVPMTECRSDGASLQLTWDFTTPGLTLTRKPGYGPPRRIIRALLGPPPPRWPRATVTDVRNDEFSARKWCSDWLMSTLSFGRLAARRQSELWFELKIAIETEPPAADAIEIVIAAARAFSFLLGRRLSFRGYEDVTADYEARYLAARNRPVTLNELPQPLGQDNAYHEGIEGLLAQATEFFLTEDGRRVAGYLHLCWDTADNDITTRMAIASISLEGLLRMVSPDRRRDDESYTQADVGLVREWLNTSECRLSPRFIKRLEGFLDGLRHRRPVDILHGWQARGVLAVTRADLEAWENGRNPAAHGVLAWPAVDHEKRQALFSRFYRVLNLLNRVILQLMGFRGRYRDYAQPSWPEVDFPAALPEEL
jgi:hypothetical protein